MQNKTYSSFLTPDHVKFNYLQLEKKFLNLLGKNKRLSVELIFAIILIILFRGLYIKSGSLPSFNVSGITLAQITIWGICSSIPVAFIMLSLPQRFHLILSVVGVLAIWLLNITRILPANSSTFSIVALSIYLPLVLLCAHTYHSVSNKKYLKLAGLIFTCVFWGLSFLMIHLVFKSPSNYLMDFADINLFHMWFFLTVSRYQRKNISQKSKFEIFNPINAFRGVLWPVDMTKAGNKDEQAELWHHGIFNLLIGLSMSWIIFGILSKMNLSSYRFPMLVFLYSNIATFSTIALQNLIAGIARLFGYKINDISDFALFAKTPAEFWRKASVYNYHYNIKFVFLPLVRLTKNRFISTLITFLSFYVNHYGFLIWEIFLIAFEPWSSGPTNTKNILMRGIFVFLAQFLLLYSSQHYWPICQEKMSKPSWEWVSILLTHISRPCASIMAIYLFQLIINI